MVGAVALRPVFTNETALSLGQKHFSPAFAPSLPIEEPLIPEIIEEREINPIQESFLYDRFGQMNRIAAKGILLDAYR